MEDLEACYSVFSSSIWEVEAQNPLDFCLHVVLCGSKVPCQYMLLGTGEKSSKHSFFTAARTAGCGERHYAGKGLACGFRLPHSGSAVWLWDYLAEFCSSQVLSVCSTWGNMQPCVVWQESTTFLTGELASQGVPFSSGPSPHCRPLLPIWGVPTELHTLSRLTCVAHLHPEPPPSLHIQATGC